MNVCFEYLYRDAANYKNWGEVILEAEIDTDILEIENKVRDALIDGEFFVAENTELPTLYFQNKKSEDDHGWHEFSAVSLTDKSPTVRQTIDSLIRALDATKNNV
jgi:hypothetical protein